MKTLAGHSLEHSCNQLFRHNNNLSELMQGMGEGEGAKDVSDQIENEDQLLGAKQRDAPEEEKVGYGQLSLTLLCSPKLDLICQPF